MKLGSIVSIDNAGEIITGPIERTSRKTGRLLVRVHDRWFDASECRV